MDAAAGISPSMETIAAGLAGFTLASLLSFARKPHVVKQETPPPPDTTPKAPVMHFPGMGHDFHMLARLVAEKQRPVNLPTSTDDADDSMLRILTTFQPQLAEFGSFAWRANLNGQNYPTVSEIVGQSTYITYATKAQPQALHPTTASSMRPAWTQSNGDLGEITVNRETKVFKAVENKAEQDTDVQRKPRHQTCCGRGMDNETRWNRRSWCRSRDDEDITPPPSSQAGRGPREDYRDRWGWSRYREE